MKGKQTLYNSFRFALKGIGYALKERNFIIHFLCALVTILISFLFKISYHEWLIVILCIALVLSLEMINTAVEKIIDLLHPQKHSKAGEIKDIAAGSVLIAVTLSVITGAVIFLPKICSLFKH